MLDGKNMFKVLIVDDEIYVVALIQKLISWDKYNMEVAATANDGIKALELVKEIRPDIVIVDIRMPGYDGISFMDKVREFNKNVRFIVISGHKQFDYVKGAMHNNAEDYLLKPINKEELEHVLEKIYGQLMKNQERESELKVMEEALDTSRSYMRESLVKGLLRGDYWKQAGELPTFNERFMTDFAEGRFCLLGLIMDIPACFQSEDGNDRVHGELFLSVRESLQRVCQEAIWTEEGHICIFIVNYLENQESAFKKTLQEQMMLYQKKISKFENLSVYFCLTGTKEKLPDLEEDLPLLDRCILGRSGFKNSRIIEPGDIKESEDLLSVIWEFRKEKFIQTMEELNAEELCLCIREMYTKAFYGIEEDTMLYYRLYMQIVKELWNYFSTIGVCRESRKNYTERFKESYIKTSGTGEYIRILSCEIRRLMAENQLYSNAQGIPSVRIVKRYIAEHYQEEISLSTAAEKVNISPVYLSRLFKKEEGINFLDYLNQYRLDVAKRLLRDMRYNVLEVADMTGFKNTRYFSKIFKKNVGLTPSEYRKRQLGKDAE